MRIPNRCESVRNERPGEGAGGGLGRPGHGIPGVGGVAGGGSLAVEPLPPPPQDARDRKTNARRLRCIPIG